MYTVTTQFKPPKDVLQFMIAKLRGSYLQLKYTNSYGINAFLRIDSSANSNKSASLS